MNMMHLQYYTPEQDKVRRCFIARVAIQQWLAWKKAPHLMGEETVERGFEQASDWLRVVKSAGYRSERDMSRDLVDRLRDGAGRTELIEHYGDNNANSHAHRLNTLHRLIDAAVNQQEKPLSDTEVLPIREEQILTTREIAGEIRLLEPYRSIIIARQMGWSDPEIRSVRNARIIWV